VKLEVPIVTAGSHQVQWEKIGRQHQLKVASKAELMGKAMDRFRSVGLKV
jgi:hypothetical protein